MRKISNPISKLSLKSNTLRTLALELVKGGARNDSLDSPSCNICGDWPTSPFRGCTL